MKGNKISMVYNPLGVLEGYSRELNYQRFKNKLHRVSSGNKCTNFAKKEGIMKGYCARRSSKSKTCLAKDSILDNLEMKINSETDDHVLFRVNMKGNSHLKDAMHDHDNDYYQKGQETDLLKKGKEGKSMILNGQDDHAIKSLFEDDQEFERFINVLMEEAERVLKENNLRDHRKHEEWFIRKSDKEFYRESNKEAKVDRRKAEQAINELE